MTSKQADAIIKSYPIPVIEQIIDSYIYHDRNREIAKKKLFMGAKYEPLSEEYEITPRHCWSIVQQAKTTILCHLP